LFLGVLIPIEPPLKASRNEVKLTQLIEIEIFWVLITMNPSVIGSSNAINLIHHSLIDLFGDLIAKEPTVMASRKALNFTKPTLVGLFFLLQYNVMASSHAVMLIYLIVIVLFGGSYRNRTEGVCLKECNKAQTTNGDMHFREF
jgi:hypothetical protein